MAFIPKLAAAVAITIALAFASGRVVAVANGSPDGVGDVVPACPTSTTTAPTTTTPTVSSTIVSPTTVAPTTVAPTTTVALTSPPTSAAPAAPTPPTEVVSPVTTAAPVVEEATVSHGAPAPRVLPSTGTSPAPTLAAGLAALTLGTGMVLLVRRRAE